MQTVEQYLIRWLREHALWPILCCESSSLFLLSGPSRRAAAERADRALLALLILLTSRQRVVILTFSTPHMVPDEDSPNETCLLAYSQTSPGEESEGGR